MKGEVSLDGHHGEGETSHSCSNHNKIYNDSNTDRIPIADKSLMMMAHEDNGGINDEGNLCKNPTSLSTTATGTATTCITSKEGSRQEVDDEARSSVHASVDREEKKQEHDDDTDPTHENENENDNHNSHQNIQDYLHHMAPMTNPRTFNSTTDLAPRTVVGPGILNDAAATTKKAGTLWWERVVVQRSSYVVEDLVRQYMADSAFLQSDTFPVAWFDRIEIETGDLLGSGTYSNVSQIKRLVLVPEFLADHPVQDQLRRELVETVPQPQQCDAPVSDESSPPEAATNAPDTTTGYAIKHLKSELLQNSKLFEAAAADLIMEAKFLSRLSHPNILRLRGMAMGGTAAFAATGLYDSYFLIVDELKETLIERIHRWKAQGSTDQYRSSMILYKLRLALQVASALVYLHERRLVFRDLKPHNIGIREDGTIQLFDFGFCRELPPLASALSPSQVASGNCAGGSRRIQQGHTSPTNAKHQPATLPESNFPVVSNDDDEEEEEEQLYCMSGKGTLLYMSPEVLGTRCYNQKADVYSWSMVTYELLTLQKPFSLASIEQHRKAICERGQRPPLHHLRWLSSAVQELLQHAWQADVQARWHMKDVMDSLEKVIQGFEGNSYSRHSSFNSYTAPKSFLCQGMEFDDIILDLTNSVQARYQMFTNVIFCQGNAAQVDDATAATGEGSSTAAIAPTKSSLKMGDAPKGTEPQQEGAVPRKKAHLSIPPVEKESKHVVSPADDSCATGAFGQASQRLPQTSERFQSPSLCMDSVRLTAARNRQMAGASSCYSSHARAWNQSLHISNRDDGSPRHLMKSSLQVLELEETASAASANMTTTNISQPGVKSGLQTIKSEDDDVDPQIVRIDDGVGSLTTIKSEDESGLEDVPLEGHSNSADMQGTFETKQKGASLRFIEEEKSANPQDNSEFKAYMASTASV